LLGIAREKRDYAQRLFRCLAGSIRPLRVEELADILAIQFDTETLPNYDVNWRPENPEEAVLSACSSLITIVDIDTSRVVQFSHFSVKEYLSSDRLATRKDLSQYHILPQSAHTILAQASLSVLLALDGQIDKEKIKSFPLAIYAARYWVDHAQFDNVCSSIELAMERLFDPTKPYFSACVWIYDIDHRLREIMFDARPKPPDAVPLYYATLCGFRDLVEHLIVKYPLDVNARGGYHATPLHSAVVKGNVDVLVLLLEHGADVAALGWGGFTPLSEASRRGRLDIMSLLLDHHADVNSRGKTGGWTALLKASFEGELEVARVLLRHGAAADIGSNDGSTALISASRHRHLDIVRLLLESGASVNQHNNDGWTPLLSASQRGHQDVVSLLLQNGAAVSSRNKYGSSPLGLASKNGHLDVVRLLLQIGAAVDSSDNDGWTPLMSASRHEHPDIVHLLLENGAAVDSRNNKGWTPLALASKNGHLDVVRLLLQHSAAADSRNKSGWASLALASENGHLDIVWLLLQGGAPVDSSPNDGWSPSSGKPRFPFRCSAGFSSSPVRFESRGPTILYFSPSGICWWPSQSCRSSSPIRCRC
jgi:ankyrin repeat protein